MTGADERLGASRAGPGASTPGVSRGAALVVLLLLVVVGGWLRTRDLGALRPTPDDGNYQHSARLDVLPRGGGPLSWLRQDARWMGELYTDFFRGEDKTTYPHGYAEQWVARQAYRMGSKRLPAVRISSALLGTLLALALYRLVRTVGLGRGAALGAAALTALAPIQVWYSRSAWGQMGCTFFFVLYLIAAYRLFDPARTHTRGGLVRHGLALAAFALLAYGWHEMIVVHVAWMGVVALLVPLWSGPDPARRGCVRRALASPRTWTYVLSSLPVLCLLAALFFLNPWARETWLNPSKEAPDLWTRLSGGSAYLLRQHVELRITWPILLFALAGVLIVARKAPFAMRFLVANAIGGVLLYFFFFSNPSLVRIYLPSIAILFAFAGAALAEPVLHLATRSARLAFASVVGLVLVYLAATSAVTLFGELEHPLAIHEFYWPDGVDRLEQRHELDPVVAVLRGELATGEQVGVYASHEPLHRVLDAGLAARYFGFQEPRERWPRFLLGNWRLLEGTLNANFPGGHPYAAVAEETCGRIRLYRLAP